MSNDKPRFETRDLPGGGKVSIDTYWQCRVEPAPVGVALVPGRHFRKRPVVIEAVRFHHLNYDEVLDFAKGSFCTASTFSDGVIIATLEGHMEASPGDWIIKGVKGEFYPCKPDIFAATYEPAEKCIGEGVRVEPKLHSACFMAGCQFADTWRELQEVKAKLRGVEGVARVEPPHEIDAFRWTGNLAAFERWFGQRCPVDAGEQISVPTGEGGGYLRVWCGSWIIRRPNGVCYTLRDDTFRYLIDEYNGGIMPPEAPATDTNSTEAP